MFRVWGLGVQVFGFRVQGVLEGSRAEQRGVV